MKKTFLIFSILSPLLPFAQSDSCQGIKWAEGLSWNQIKERAKEENKFIFVDAYATWCAPCKKMDKEVYPDKKVGDAMNPYFISVKIQMDRTDKDDETIKSSYKFAEMLQSKYQPNGYPTFYFFTPDGKLAHRGIGFLDLERFLQLAKEALTDPVARYERDIEKFKKAQLEFQNMPALANEAWQRKEKELAIAIVRDYKTNYVDKITDEEAFTHANLYLIADFATSIPLTSGDRYFKFFYACPDIADSIINRVLSGKRQKVVNDIVTSIIGKEEVGNKIYDNGKPISGIRPNWEKYKDSIEKKYGTEYNSRIFPDAQIFYYASVSDWKHFAKYVDEKIRTYPPDRYRKLYFAFGPSFALNYWAWDIFTKCNDKKVLKKAVEWAELALQLEPSNSAIVDTKANLLYKIGKIRQAITCEEQAVKLSKNEKKYITTLEKMKAGLITWPAGNQ
jgi:thioredoxin-related protein